MTEASPLAGSGLASLSPPEGLPQGRGKPLPCSGGASPPGQAATAGMRRRRHRRPCGPDPGHTTSRTGGTLTFGSKGWQEFVTGLKRPSRVGHRVLSESYRLAGLWCCGRSAAVN